MQPRILDRATAFASPWLEVEQLDVDLGPPRGRETFYTVRTHPYVVVLAVTTDGRVPLVRQYRPAVDEVVLELPSGHVDEGETPADAARRELLEETGCEAGELVFLGELHVDSGRLQTRQLAFLAPESAVVGPPSGGDEQLEVELVELARLRKLVTSGELRLAPHVGVIGLAALRGLLAV